MSVKTATTGREAISTIDAAPELASCCGHHDAEMDGYQTMQVIRQNPTMRRCRNHRADARR